MASTDTANLIENKCSRIAKETLMFYLTKPILAMPIVLCSQGEYFMKSKIQATLINWICNCFALVAYAILIMNTINYFFHIFKEVIISMQFLLAPLLSGVYFSLP